MINMCQTFIQSYNEFGSTYNIENMNEIINMYNENLLLVGLNNLAPCYEITIYNVNTYNYAYAALLMAVANIKSKFNL